MLVVVIAIVAATVAAVLLTARAVRLHLRRKSLRQEGGMWHWIGFDGQPDQSETYPDGPGGAWREESWLAGFRGPDGDSPWVGNDPSD